MWRGNYGLALIFNLHLLIAPFECLKTVGWNGLGRHPFKNDNGCAEVGVYVVLSSLDVIIIEMILIIIIIIIGIISRKDKIRNNIIKQKMNVTRSLLEDIKTKQLKWYGHVQRMEEGRLPKKVMKWSPPGRRKRGRPKLT